MSANEASEVNDYCINNECQYRVTKTLVVKLTEALKGIKKGTLVCANPLIVEAVQSALESQIADLYTDIHEYEKRFGIVNENENN